MPPPMSAAAMLQAQSSAGNQSPPLSSGSAPPAPMSAAQMLQAQGGQPAPSGPENSWQATGGFLANGLSGIEKPLVSLAATPLQLGVAATNFLDKNLGSNWQKSQNIPDPYNSIGGLSSKEAGFPSIPGSNSRTLSVPSITPAGLIQKAGQLGQVGSFALAPEADGLKGLTQMALLGGFGSGSSYVAGGGTDFSLNPLDNSGLSKSVRQGAVWGGMLGLLGLAARGVSNTEKAAAGVDEATANDLANTRPSTLGKLIQMAKDTVTNHHATGPSDWLNSQLREGANILDKKVLPTAGKAIDEARKGSSNLPLTFVSSTGAPLQGQDAVSALRDQVNELLQNNLGHQFSDYATGETGGLKIQNYPQGASTGGLSLGDNTVVPLANRPGLDPLSSTEQKDMEYLSGKLQILGEHPNVQTASDIVNGLDRYQIDWEAAQKYGAKSSPLESIMQQVRGMINHEMIRPSAPDLAAANDIYGPLARAKAALAKAAGNNLEHLDLLARRSLYNGQSGDAQSVLDTLYAAVKPYLPAGEESYTTKAFATRFVRDTFGGITSRTGLNQSAQGLPVGDAIGLGSQYRTSFYRAVADIGKKLMKPSPEQYAMSLSRKEPYSFVPLVHHIDEFLQSPSAAPWLQTAKDAMKKMGVSSGGAGWAGQKVLRMIMLNNLNQSASQQNLPQQNGRTLSQ